MRFTVQPSCGGAAAAAQTGGGRKGGRAGRDGAATAIDSTRPLGFYGTSLPLSVLLAFPYFSQSIFLARFSLVPSVYLSLLVFTPPLSILLSFSMFPDLSSSSALFYLLRSHCLFPLSISLSLSLVPPCLLSHCLRAVVKQW